MSMELHVLLRDSSVPTPSQWQNAIREAGFDLTLDATLSMRDWTGFLPAVYKGVKTGFEFDVSDASDITDTYPDVAEHVGDRDVSANFRWGGDLRECVAAVVASAALAELCDGVLYDPQEGAFHTGDEALETARQIVESVGDDL